MELVTISASDLLDSISTSGCMECTSEFPFKKLQNIRIFGLFLVSYISKFIIAQNSMDISFYEEFLPDFIISSYILFYVVFVLNFSVYY